MRAPWRLIAYLFVLALVVAFAAVNVPNASDVSFGFYTFRRVPVFLSLFVAFLLGAFLMLPFVLKRKHARTTEPEGRAAAKHGNAHAHDGPSTPEA